MASLLTSMTIRHLCKPPLLTGCTRFHFHTQTIHRIRHQTRKEAKDQSSLGQAFLSYLKRLRWVPIPLGVGFAYISYQQYGHVREREERKEKSVNSAQDLLAKDWQVKLYRCIPLKAMSRVWGQVNSLELPTWLRSPLLNIYIWAFNCNLQEAAIRDLTHYKNLGEFFRRRLRPSCRPIDPKSCMTSPSDGRVLHFGSIKRGQVEQVKGVTYSLEEFLGPLSWEKDLFVGESYNSNNKKDYQHSIKKDAENELYHCVIYLAPGDYHGFHSPAKWTLKYRRHYPGELLSVNPGVARLIKGLFNLNERAVYMGTWEHGFFSIIAVGATNVGSMKIYCDRGLKTNNLGDPQDGAYLDENFQRTDLPGIPMAKGEAFGEFNLGSTIVLVFEAPKDFDFKIKNGQKVKFGESLGVRNS